VSLQKLKGYGIVIDIIWLSVEVDVSSEVSKVASKKGRVLSAFAG